MKLRLRGNTVRLRLTKGEVRDVALAVPVVETVEITPGSAFVYELRSDPSVPTLGVTLEGARLVVVVPTTIAERWAEGDDVGFEATQTVREGVSLYVLVEKDFACLRPREGDDDVDTFDHPRAPGAGAS